MHNSNEINWESYGSVYPSLVSTFLGCRIKDIVCGKEFLARFIPEDHRESFLKEPWGAPPGVAMLEMEDVEKPTFCIGYVGFKVAEDGTRFVIESNASPFKLYIKRRLPELTEESSEHRELWGRTEGCTGNVVCQPGGGVKCNKCAGWFCY